MSTGVEVRRCPHCKEPILMGAKKCKHCREHIPSARRSRKSAAQKIDRSRKFETQLLKKLFSSMEETDGEFTLTYKWTRRT